MLFGSKRREDAEKDGQDARHAYECLRNLLNRNTLLLEQMSEIEADLRFYLSTSPAIQKKISRTVDETLLLSEDLNVLTQDRFKGLYRAFDRIRGEVSRQLSAVAEPRARLRSAQPLARRRQDTHSHRGLAGGAVGSHPGPHARGPHLRLLLGVLELLGRGQVDL